MIGRRRLGVTLIEMLVIIAIIAVLLGLALPAIRAAREEARRAQCVGHLKQLALGLYNYEANFGMFPPGRLNTRVAGKGNCWGTHALILPYLEQRALSDSLNFDLPPDTDTSDAPGSANRTATMTVLNSLICPSDPAPGWVGVDGVPQATTNYLFNVGAGYLVVTPGTREFDRPDGIFFENSAVRIADISDGTSSVVMLAETIRSFAETTFRDDPLGGLVITGDDRTNGPAIGSDADYDTRCQVASPPGFRARRGVQWAFGAPGATLYNHRRPPNDGRVDCRGGLPQSDASLLEWDRLSLNVTARSRHPGGVNVSMADGSIRFIKETIADDSWQSIGDRNDAGGRVRKSF